MLFLKAMLSLAEEANLADVYGKSKVKGCAKPITDCVLTKQIHPGGNELYPLYIYISVNITKDVRELNFARYKGSIFEGFQRRIIPFVIPPTTMLDHRWCRWE